MPDTEKKSPKNGVFVSKAGIVLTGLAFLSAILITALITYGITFSTSYYFYDFSLPTPTQEKEYQKPNEAKFKEDLPMPPIQNADEDFRLPKALMPEYYFLFLQPFFADTTDGNGVSYPEFTINGYEEITFSVLQKTSKIVLHADTIDISEGSIEILDSSNNSIAVIDSAATGNYDFYTITIDGNFTIGETYSLSMNFTSYFTDNLQGFYKSSTVNADGEEGLMGVTQFETTYARKTFPCFDEPEFKAKFEIQVFEHARPTYSNSGASSTTKLTSGPWNNWKIYAFSPTKKMSTYLLAIVNVPANDYLLNINTDNTVKVYTQVNMTHLANFASDVGPDILDFYETFLNYDYSYGKLQLFSVPALSPSAMENWGLITFRESSLLLDESYVSASNKQRVGLTIAHEIAHQWFGNVVTPEWWNYIWLSEGFASYFEYYGLDASKPDYNLIDQSVLSNNIYGLSKDCLSSSRPVSNTVDSPDNIEEVFDAIAYNKGASIIRMMEFFLTRDVFWEGLNTYLNDFKYKTAIPDDLFEILTTVAHDNKTLDNDITVTDIMNTWTLQIGYPVINVVIDYANNLANITQKQFSFGTSDNLVWWIPLSYTTELDKDFTITYPKEWMSESETSFDIGNIDAASWVLFNIKMGGFYRVNYDSNNWMLLTTQLQNQPDDIDLVNRAQLLDDALNLARGGDLEYETALSLCSYLKSETEYVPWSSALSSLLYLEQMFTRKEGYGAMSEFLLDQVLALYISTGFEDSMDDPHLEQLGRELAVYWTCHLGYEDCITSATDEYSIWMENPYYLISPNIKATSCCTGIAEGDEAEWNFAYDQYISYDPYISNNTGGPETDLLIDSMGCSKQYWILQRYLEYTFAEDSKIKQQDASRVFSAVTANDYGRDIAWQYLQNNWDDIAVYYGGSSAMCATFTEIATREFNSETKLTELNNLITKHEDDFSTTPSEFDIAVANVETNIEWMANSYDDVNSWLSDNCYGDDVGPNC